MFLQSQPERPAKAAAILVVVDIPRFGQLRRTFSHSVTDIVGEPNNANRNGSSTNARSNVAAEHPHACTGLALNLRF